MPTYSLVERYVLTDRAAGPNIIREYFKNPEATRNAFTPDGWFRTGDIAHFSKDGKLFIVGRSKVSADLLNYYVCGLFCVQCFKTYWHQIVEFLC